MTAQYFDRDLSWLSFNERVLQEAGSSAVPVAERVKFLSIFSSNLDEFYRVRMPALMGAATRQDKSITGETHLAEAQKTIQRQQEYFGEILKEQILPGLKEHHVHVLYNEPVPLEILKEVEAYFFSSVAGFLEIVSLTNGAAGYFSENNKLYQVVLVEAASGGDETMLITIPSDRMSRFFSVEHNGVLYILFIDDIIRLMLPKIFRGNLVKGAYNIKITRDAELDLEEDIATELSENIEEKIALRERGYATRFLYEPGIPLRILYLLTDALQVTTANIVAGGKYHNLKDLAELPINHPSLNYPKWPACVNAFVKTDSLFDAILEKDRIVHTPYQSYNAILRFFNEAAIDQSVAEVYVTMYRIASDSKIAHALITAARNGKKVVVFVELKARFDEANNIRWAKQMKAAGIKIIYSIPYLKVHAKVALVKKQVNDRMVYLGLLSTGNLNETTAKFYTDHILLTARQEMLAELEMLFIFLGQQRKPADQNELDFKHLLVAQFNLQPAFYALIDQEISHAKAGRPAKLTIKLNNLEEKRMINKLYEAAQAGVNIHLIVRSICCLKPGQPGISENIIITRIVDRYLEHGRVFIFHNDGQEQIYLGSADWMNRNIYSRIEVCFPVLDEDIRAEIKRIIALQVADNVQAVYISESLKNVPVRGDESPVRSQQRIYELLASQ